VTYFLIRKVKKTSLRVSVDLVELQWVLCSASHSLAGERFA